MTTFVAPKGLAMFNAFCPSCETQRSESVTTHAINTVFNLSMKMLMIFTNRNHTMTAFTLSIVKKMSKNVKI